MVNFKNYVHAFAVGGRLDYLDIYAYMLYNLYDKYKLFCNYHINKAKFFVKYHKINNPLKKGGNRGCII